MKQLIRNIKFGFVNQYFYRIVGYNKNNQKFKYVDYGFQKTIECLGKHKILKGKYSTLQIPQGFNNIKWLIGFENEDEALNKLLEIVDGDLDNFSVVINEQEFEKQSITLRQLSTLTKNQIRQLDKEVA